jgi:hypothetical protein
VREEVLGGLDFFDEATNSLPPSVGRLRYGEGWFYVDRHVWKADGSRTYEIPKSSISLRCVSADGKAALTRPSGEAYDWFLRDLETQTEQRLWWGLVGREFCAFEGTKLTIQTGSDIHRYDLTTGVATVHAPVDTLLGTSEQRLVQWTGGYVAVAEPGDGGLLSWRNVRHLPYKGFIQLQHGYVVTSRASHRNQRAVVVRSSVSGEKLPQVVAEMSATVGSGLNWWTVPIPALTDNWVAYDRSRQPSAESPAYFVPYAVDE